MNNKININPSSTKWLEKDDRVVADYFCDFPAAFTNFLKYFGSASRTGQQNDVNALRQHCTKEKFKSTLRICVYSLDQAGML